MGTTMSVYLFRHGDRTSRTPDAEPELSGTGLLQADHLRAWVARGTLPAPTRLWVSPRHRAQQTFTPLAESLGISLEVLPELDERTPRESAVRFRERVNHLLDRARAVNGMLFLCSHFDWLEEAITLIPADEDLAANAGPLWAPGSFVGFDTEDDLWHVRQKGQLQTW